ncbi:T-cell surface glycoprotein CD5 [Rhinatrema bivittatum]|uniref:T-cell surface glycoprotein CD5 n=1 Tax=Rhinatrema bivittatum TaxID=194408 RepID=UPI00112A7647|nr:T-cell surface glycoprotein CD5 [Rhinatrema bivittatum]XP_029430816.1 T-cell surface glycoprotein CD5 [Rhinatrema bivittatum]
MWTGLLTALLSLWTLMPCPSCGGPGSSSGEQEERPSSGNCTCVGRLELPLNSTWKPVCKDPWDLKTLEVVCRNLGCDQPVGILSRLNFTEEKGSKLSVFSEALQCQANETRLLNCVSSRSKANCTHEEDAIVVCTASHCTPALTTTTPTPTKPPAPGRPRFRLVEGSVTCSGTVELYLRGRWGTVCIEKRWKPYSDSICRNLGCGSALQCTHLEVPRGLSPAFWQEQGCANLSNTEQCFQESQSCKSLHIICSNFQPKVATRLVNGTSRCEGNVEVYHNGSWTALCRGGNEMDSRGQEVCREQRCGKPVPRAGSEGSSEQSRRGVRCHARRLEECHHFESISSCTPARVACEDPGLKKSKGLGAGDVMSIILALLLLGFILAVCGPPIYKKVMKKYNKKKERQWIGPTGASQSISFHRNTVNRHSYLQAQSGDNEYSEAPKKNSYLSAYPALERATDRASFPVENSSDSEYDLQMAHRL